MLVQLAVEILPVARTQSHAEAEIDDAFHPRIKAVVENPIQIFHGVIDIRQSRAKPHDRGDPAPLKLFYVIFYSRRLHYLIVLSIIQHFFENGNHLCQLS